MNKKCRKCLIRVYSDDIEFSYEEDTNDYGDGCFKFPHCPNCGYKNSHECKPLLPQEEDAENVY